MLNVGICGDCEGMWGLYNLGWEKAKQELEQS